MRCLLSALGGLVLVLWCPAQAQLGWSKVGGGVEARTNHAIAYDVARQRVVLFGGAGASYRDHMMAYDLVRKRVVLFGGQGQNGGFFNDTWGMGRQQLDKALPHHPESGRTHWPRNGV